MLQQEDEEEKQAEPMNQSFTYSLYEGNNSGEHSPLDRSKEIEMKNAESHQNSNTEGSAGYPMFTIQQV